MLVGGAELALWARGLGQLPDMPGATVDSMQRSVKGEGKGKGEIEVNFHTSIPNKAKEINCGIFFPGPTESLVVPKEEMVTLEGELSEMRTMLALIEEEVNLVCIS